MKDEKMPEPSSDVPPKKTKPSRSRSRSLGEDHGEDGDGVGRDEAEEGEERRV